MMNQENKTPDTDAVDMASKLIEGLNQKPKDDTEESKSLEAKDSDDEETLSLVKSIVNNSKDKYFMNLFKKKGQIKSHTADKKRKAKSRTQKNSRKANRKKK